MKRNIIILGLLFLLLININVLALDKLVEVPTADLVGGKGFISGELLGSTHRQVSGLYNVSPSLALGGIVEFGHNYTEPGILAKLILVQEGAEQLQWL